VHRSWLYKLLARYRSDGSAGLEPRSRRPHRSPTRTALVWEERVVAVRKELADQGRATSLAPLPPPDTMTTSQAADRTHTWAPAKRSGTE
jgi:hypothetical protein